jgi:ankyrin repeat protein
MDDEDLAQALALSLLEPSREARDLPSLSDLPKATLHILLRILRKVTEEPDKSKFRSLKKTTNTLSQDLFPHQDAVAFLCACGFEESNEGVQLPDGADLKLVDEALNSVRTALEAAGKPTPPPPTPPPAAKSPVTPGASAVDQIMEAVKDAGAFSSVSDLAPPAAELAVWRRQQSLGVVGFIFEGEAPHALLELGTRVLDIGADVDGGAKGTVVGWKTAKGRFFDTSAGCSNKNGCVRVYYDKKPAAHDGNPWNVMAANRLLFLDAAAPDPPYDTLTRSRPPEAKGDYGGKFGVGSRVRVKKSVSAPAYGWGGVEHGMEGVVIKIDSDGDLKVDFPGIATGWSCKAYEMEAVGGDGGGMGGGTGPRTGGGHSAPSKRDTTQREHLKMQKSQMMQMLQMARASASIDRVPDNPEHASIWPHGAPHPDLRVGVRVRDSRSGVCGYVLGWVHKGVHYGDVSGGLESGGERGARVRFDRTTQEIRQHEWNLDARRLEFITGDLNNIFVAAAESVTRLEALLNSPGCNPNVRDALGASPLWHACRAGSLECTRLLLERRADVQVQPRGKLSPLGVAAQFGFILCVQLLLDHRANMEAVDEERYTPLFAAVRGAHSSCVEVLVNARANLESKTKPLECTPLGWLCCVEPNLNRPILQMLLRGGANVNAYQFDAISRSMSPLHFAVLGDRTDAVEWLLANGANVHVHDADGDPPVLVACVADHPECCRLLLGAKADANTTKDDGTTLLNAAAHGGSTECVQLLLEHGAAQTMNKMDRIGTHAMHWACQDAYPKILELLCKAKADVENKNGKGGSPLMLALAYEEDRKDVKLECVRILIEHKVDVNAIDPRDGESALGYVSKKGSIEAAELLLKAGATATIGRMDHRGAHPMHWACQEANPPLLKLLIEAKGNVEQPNGKGGTPLMLATCDPGPRNVECLRMLLKAKADPNQLDHDGDPAIIRTMIRDDEAQSAALLEAGARANATDHHGISLVQRFGALAQSKMLRLLIQHGADVSGVLDLVQVGFSSGMVKKPAQDQNEVLQLLRDAPSVRARFLEEQRAKEQAERSQQEAEARRKAQDEEEAAAKRRRADDRKVLVAWLRDTCRLPEDELVSVAEIFLVEDFHTVSLIEALQGRNREYWPEKLSKGHRVRIDEAVLRTRRPSTPPAPPHDDTAASEKAAAKKAADEKAAAAKASADKAAAEKTVGAAAAEAPEELRRRATALGFLQMLTSLNVAEDATLKTAVVWCDEQGATSVSDIVECDLVDDFVRHLGLKPIPGKRLRTMLQALRAASSSSSPSPQLEWDPHKPTFYFLPRAAVLDATATQLKRMQELRDSELLEKMAVDLNEAFQGKGLIQNVLFVSHRWEDSATPDETGAQLAALKAHLMSHPEVQYIWFDYSCMPQRSSGCPPDQDDRTPAEKAEFDLMLKAIADLYLTAKVLILLDKMYLTRFWTTMEGWCAMQQVTSEGVRPATEGESRVTVMRIHNATQHDERALLEMSTKTPTEMSNFLASPDVTVTNRKDKETMLPIVGETDKHVREMMRGMHGS